MNAGKGNGLQYSACYVLPVGDSMEEIFDSVKAAAIIHKSGGGTGFAFSRLRPKDDIVALHGRPRLRARVVPARVQRATEAVKQGGTRRGANMGILRVDHPDILEFIDCKLDGGITNFNISVAATDAFMDALATGADYDLINPHSGRGDAAGSPRARSSTGSCARPGAPAIPGMVFIDRINAEPGQPDARSSATDRGDQSVRRAAAAAQRGVQPRLAQRLAVRPPGRGRRVGRSTGTRWSG